MKAREYLKWWGYRYILLLEDLGFHNKKFWTGFIISSFPASLDEDADMGLSELMGENELVDIDIDWWNNFTKYYDGVLDETDGYVDDPEMLIYKLTDTQTLKIEFHPGDIVYYVNDKQIACIGGEYMIQIFPFADLLKYMECQKDNRLFLLLLPLVIIGEEEVSCATKIISGALEEIFDTSLCNQFARCIVYGLMEE